VQGCARVSLGFVEEALHRQLHRRIQLHAEHVTVSGSTAAQTTNCRCNNAQVTSMLAWQARPDSS
jgi:hypothetical protein